MTRTAFIGAYGYGNLGDELCLIEAMQAFPASEAHVYTVDWAWTSRCVPGLAGGFVKEAEMLALAPERVVYGGGGIGTRSAFRRLLPWLGHAAARGAEIRVHNVGVSGDLRDSWLDEEMQGIFAALADYTVRDPRSVYESLAAGVRRLPGLTLFPERLVEPDFTLADMVLPRDGRKLLGISIINMPLMHRCLEQDAARVEATLAEFRGWSVVPVVSTIHRHAEAEHDGEGLRRFLARFLPGAELVAPWLMDRGPWYDLLTPRRLKGLIARCDALVTQRKHNAVHGIGAGVRTIGLHPRIDDSLRRTFVALSTELAPGSACIGLEDGEG